jgi:hypothetical protein
MIVRMGLNFGAHLAAGVAMGALAVLAAAYVMEQQRRRDGEPAPAAGGAGGPSPRPGEPVRNEPAEGEVAGDPGAI